MLLQLLLLGISAMDTQERRREGTALVALRQTKGGAAYNVRVRDSHGVGSGGSSVGAIQGYSVF